MSVLAKCHQMKSERNLEMKMLVRGEEKDRLKHRETIIQPKNTESEK